ncbi:hypothetical protein CEV08_02770 [Bartonella tribocorum]|uniref:Uncharacterized protein n=1 Tax=Bartonella tribocorum TaxID=85701 RepID=A0A2M6UWW1_9HYPH|nr:hypothetical protein CEV08_02770 [Bartonella tribocorum]
MSGKLLEFFRVFVWMTIFLDVKAYTKCILSNSNLLKGSIYENLLVNLSENKKAGHMETMVTWKL